MTETKRILLVEDSESDLQLTVRQLRMHGVTNEIAIARSGIEALAHLFPAGRLLPSPHVLPFVVLLDLGLPLIHGVDVLHRIRADLRTKTLPVIILSDSQSDVDAMHCLTLRASGLLAKPLVFEAFARALRHIGLAEHLTIDPKAGFQAEGDSSHRRERA